MESLSMRIAQVAPLIESVPPTGYGGTERVVAYLTEALVDHGHDVTLFASGDSRTRARLIGCGARALRQDPTGRDPVAAHLVMLEEVYRRAAEFDVVHFHCDYLHFPMTRREGIPSVTTLHGRLDLPALQDVYREFDDAPVVSISDDQRRPLPMARWVATVHHGLPRELHRPTAEAGDYLAFIGRISPEKRVDRAIEIARRTGLRLKIAAKIDRADREYAKTLRDQLDAPWVDYLGELGDADKGALLRGAVALLFPIDWPEPFGLVMIEAMACGTPVIAWPGGSVPEVIDDGVTGVIVGSVDDAVAAVGRVARFDRRAVRARFDRRFTADRMAADYVGVYAQLISARRRTEAA
jgi:glycosyltransferase involved in cell wall biosynthesis